MRRVGVVAAALAVLAATAPVDAAHGQSGVPPTDTVLRLVAQSPPIAAEGTFELTVTASGAVPAGSELVASVGRRILGTRTQDARDVFRATLTATGSRPQLTLAELDGPATVTARIGTYVRNAAAAAEPLRVQLPAEGVYPLRVALLDPDTGDERAGFTTFITRLPAPTADQPVPGPLLDVALVVPFGARPALAPDGTSVAPEAAEVAPLRTLTEALISHQDVPVTLAAVPETVDALDRLQGGNDLVAQLRSSLAFRQVLAATYVRTDVSALVESGLTQEVQDQLTVGGRTLGELLGDGRPPDRRTVVLTPGLRASGLRQLRDLGFFQAIAPPGLLADDPVPEPGNRVGPAPTTKDDLVIGGDRFGSVLSADAALTAALRPAADADPVLAAYHLLAELAVIALDQASITRAGGPRGIVLWAGDDWEPDPVFLDALLTGLSGSATLVTPRTVDDLFTTVTASRDADGVPVTRRLADVAGPGLDPAYVTGLALTRITLASFEQFVGSTSPLLADLRERLLVASSTDLDAAERAAFLQAVNAAIRRQQNAVQPVDNGTQTLTSRRSRIIFVIRKTTDDPLTVKVSLRSDKLEFDGGGEVTLTLRDRSTVVEIPVRALATGTFPLEVQLASPDYTGPGRGFLLSSTTITIRSIAVPGVGIALSVGALAVLCLWWLSHIRAERRRRRAHSRQVHPTGALDAGTVKVGGDDRR